MDDFEKELFELADAFGSDPLTEAIEQTPFIEDPVSPSFLRSVQARALAKLDAAQEQPGSIHSVKGSSSWRRVRRLKWGAAAVLLLLAVGAVGAVARSPVLAQVHKMLEFLPGFGTVVQTPDATTTSYVLKVPVAVKTSGGTIDITGAVWNPGESTLQVSGPAGTWAPRRITIIGPDGKSYVFHYENIASAGKWFGEYEYKGAIAVSSQTTNKGGSAVAKSMGWDILYPGETSAKGHLTLVKAQSAADYRALGPTVTKRGVAITAMAAKFDDTVQVTFVSPPSSLFQITDYDLVGQTNKDPAVKVTDSRAHVLPTNPIEVFGTPNEFQFQPKRATDNRFIVTVPHITEQFADTIDVDVPIPAPNQTITWNHTVSWSGFTLKLTDVYRTETNIHVGVQVVRAPFAYERLTGFGRVSEVHQPDAPMSYTIATNQQTMNLKWFALDVDAHVGRSVDIQLGEPQVVVEGPWTFSLHVG